MAMKLNMPLLALIGVGLWAWSRQPTAGAAVPTSTADILREGGMVSVPQTEIWYWTDPTTGEVVYAPGLTPPAEGWRPASSNEITAATGMMGDTGAALPVRGPAMRVATTPKMMVPGYVQARTGYWVPTYPGYRPPRW